MENEGREGDGEGGGKQGAAGGMQPPAAMPDILGSLLVSVVAGAVAAGVAAMRGLAGVWVLLAYAGAGTAALVALPVARLAVRGVRRRLDRRRAGGGRPDS